MISRSAQAVASNRYPQASRATGASAWYSRDSARPRSLTAFPTTGGSDG